MNRMYLFEHEKSDHDQFLITGKRVLHITQILKKKVGDQLKIVVIDQGIGDSIIVETTPHQVRVEVKKLTPGEHTEIHLLIGLCRPPSIKKIIEHGTSLGVRSFSFFPAYHSEKSYLNSHLFKNEALDELLHLGISQSGIYYKKPSVHLYSSFQKLTLEQFSNKFFFSLNSAKSFSTLQKFKNEKILLSIGPERGWTIQEENLFVKYNFNDISLGQSILRSEIATFVALGAFQMT